MENFTPINLEKFEEKPKGIHFRLTTFFLILGNITAAILAIILYRLIKQKIGPEMSVIKLLTTSVESVKNLFYAK
jgi:hypothetical protein